jgi:transcriptional regulator with XRE-family HTH domain
MSQEELATAVGYTSRSTIARMESGDNKVDIDKVHLFAKALHTTTGYIMGTEDSPDIVTSNYTAATSDERQLLAAYRHANDDGKNVFRALTAYFLPPIE